MLLELCTSVIDFMPSPIFLLHIPMQKPSILGFKNITCPYAINKYLLKKTHTHLLQTFI